MYTDKESFVTQAYKDQLAEFRKAEEEDRKRDGAYFPMLKYLTNTYLAHPELAKKKKTLNTGMTHMYRALLEQSNTQHTAAMAPTSSTGGTPTFGPSPMPNLTITHPTLSIPPHPSILSGPGAALTSPPRPATSVELNDNNQIINHRDLLIAGLNLSAPNTHNLALLRSKSSSTATANTDQPVQMHCAVGLAASKREIAQRRQREVTSQLEAESKQIRMEREKEARVVKRRNDEGDVMSARERYLERKRRRLEEAKEEGGGLGDVGRM